MTNTDQRQGKITTHRPMGTKLVMATGHAAGWRGRCSCGWSGPVRRPSNRNSLRDETRAVMTAEEDYRAHIQREEGNRA